MRVSRWLVVMFAVAVVAGACGDDGDDAQDTASLSSPDELAAVLLGVDDLGEGWSEEQRDVFTTRAEGPPSFDPTGWCPAVTDQVAGLEDLAGETGVAVELSTEREGRSFHGVSQQLWSNTDTAEYFATFESALDTCRGTTWTVAETGDVTVGALDGPSAGDESTTALVSVVTPGPDGDYLWRSRTIVARFGTALMILTELDVQRRGSEPRFSDADWSALVEQAATAVEGLGTG